MIYEKHFDQQGLLLKYHIYKVDLTWLNWHINAHEYRALIVLKHLFYVLLIFV